MKKTILAALAIAGFVAINNASAQQISYTPGDTLMMFRATAGTGADKNLYINLGNLSSSSFTSFNLDFSSGGALATAFGSDWNRNTVLWGVIGGDNAVPNLTYGSSLAAQTDLTADNLWTITTAVDQAFYAGIGALATVGTITDNNGTSHGFSIFSSAASGSPSSQDERGFSFFDIGTIINPDSSKHLYSYRVNDNYDVLPPVTTGTVAISGTTISLQAAPEPSTYALLGVGALLLIVSYRRAKA